MLNSDRIVPVTAVDLLTLYSVALAAGSVTLTKLAATNPAEFTLTAAPASGSVFAAEPVKKFNFGSDVSAATVYFVPSYDFEDFYINGTAADVADDVTPDGRTLYLATLATGAVTISQVGL